MVRQVVFEKRFVAVVKTKVAPMRTLCDRLWPHFGRRRLAHAEKKKPWYEENVKAVLNCRREVKKW
jgi:hypothetical protein